VDVNKLFPGTKSEIGIRNQAHAHVAVKSTMFVLVFVLFLGIVVASLVTYSGEVIVVETIAMPCSMLAFRKLCTKNQQHRQLPPVLLIRGARNMDNNRLLQYFDLLAATSKQRTIKKCHLTYRSKISIIIGFGG